MSISPMSRRENRFRTKHGQVVDILKANEIDEQMKSLSWLVTLHDLDQTYSGTTIVCTIDAKSQNDALRALSDY